MTASPVISLADTSLLGGPIGIAVNKSYVATSHASGSVNVYSQPVSASSTPSATFGAAAAGFMTFDASGDLWAASQSTSVVEYVPPFTNSTVEATWITSGVTKAYGIAFDASGNLYVSNSDSSAAILVFAPPYTSAPAKYVVPNTNVSLHGLAVAGSNLLVADTRNNVIYVYNLPLTTNIPVRLFAATSPVGLAVDSSGKLFVTSQFTNQVQEFDPPFGTTIPGTTFTGGLNQPFGIAAGP